MSSLYLTPLPGARTIAVQLAASCKPAPSLRCLAFITADSCASRVRRTRSLIFVFKHKKPNRRRQIALFARGCDCSNQTRHRHALETSDFFQLSPERIFKANASFVPIKPDGAFICG